MINNIVNALSVAMGINLEHQKEFIINSVIEIIQKNVKTKDKYDNTKENSKKMVSYIDYFNKVLLYNTFGMYLIAIQTSIPSIKSKKTHPGCIRSFSGYPFDGQGDLSSLNYLACIAYDNRTNLSNQQPWNVLSKAKVETIKDTIKLSIDNLLIKLTEVDQKIKEKIEYLLNSPPTDIPAEHDIASMTDFLPPLIPFKIKNLQNITAEFEKQLDNHLITGLKDKQTDKILVIESKIIQFSLSIQEKINNVVNKQQLILHTANKDPYIENACCDDTKDKVPTINYFINKNNDIQEYNKIVKKLGNILANIRDESQAKLFYSNLNTKNIYTSISNLFNEPIIYAFLQR
jgi:hypothetical protein